MTLSIPHEEAESNSLLLEIRLALRIFCNQRNEEEVNIGLLRLGQKRLCGLHLALLCALEEASHYVSPNTLRWALWKGHV